MQGHGGRGLTSWRTWVVVVPKTTCMRHAHHLRRASTAQRHGISPGQGGGGLHQAIVSRSSASVFSPVHVSLFSPAQIPRETAWMGRPSTPPTVYHPDYAPCAQQHALFPPQPRFQRLAIYAAERRCALCPVHVPAASLCHAAAACRLRVANAMAQSGAPLIDLSQVGGRAWPHASRL